MYEIRNGGCGLKWWNYEMFKSCYFGERKKWTLCKIVLWFSINKRWNLIWIVRFFGIRIVVMIGCKESGCFGIMFL